MWESGCEHQLSGREVASYQKLYCWMAPAVAYCEVVVDVVVSGVVGWLRALRMKLFVQGSLDHLA